MLTIYSYDIHAFHILGFGGGRLAAPGLGDSAPEAGDPPVLCSPNFSLFLPRKW